MVSDLERNIRTIKRIKERERLPTTPISVSDSTDGQAFAGEEATPTAVEHPQGDWP